MQSFNEAGGGVFLQAHGAGGHAGQQVWGVGDQRHAPALTLLEAHEHVPELRLGDGSSMAVDSSATR